MEQTTQLTGNELARHIASWLPDKDRAVALRMIDRAEQAETEPQPFDPIVGEHRHHWSAG